MSTQLTITEYKEPGNRRRPSELQLPHFNRHHSDLLTLVNVEILGTRLKYLLALFVVQYVLAARVGSCVPSSVLSYAHDNL